jgi:plastocyanin
MKRRLTFTAMTLLAMAASSLPTAGAEDTDHIVVSHFMFQPTTLTIKAGSTVTWVNRDEEPHTIVSATGLFRSGALDTDGTFSFRFEKPGTYPFVCSIHPQMTGTILVQ